MKHITLLILLLVLVVTAFAGSPPIIPGFLLKNGNHMVAVNADSLYVIAPNGTDTLLRCELIIADSVHVSTKYNHFVFDGIAVMMLSAIKLKWWLSPLLSCNHRYNLFLFLY